jgi:catechol 1,2-dioxygenase
MQISRRYLFKLGAAGLAAAGTGGLVLRGSAQPTEPSGDLHDYPQDPAGDPDVEGFVLGQGVAPTEKNIQGPYYEEGAPYRAKISPPMAAGTVLIVQGRVWGHDTKKPLPNTVIDIWQADTNGHYDHIDGEPSKTEAYAYRARLMTNESGYYEFETVRPGNYENGPGNWRPSHIHYWVRAAGYPHLITQLYFDGDKYNDGSDPYIKKSLIVKPEVKRVKTGSYQICTFDIVLAKT